MPLTKTLRQREKMPLPIMFVTSALITMSLFYVDEGFYNFRWMLNIGNWLIFVIYTLAIISGQILIHLLITRVFGLKGNMLWTILAGSVVAVMILVSFIFN